MGVCVEERGVGYLPIVVALELPVLERHRMNVLPDIARLLDREFADRRIVFVGVLGIDVFLWCETGSGAGNPSSRAYSTSRSAMILHAPR